MNFSEITSMSCLLKEFFSAILSAPLERLGKLHYTLIRYLATSGLAARGMPSLP
jgi:hypothetical protein